MNIPLPRGSALVEVSPGVWIKPRMVGMITVQLPVEGSKGSPGLRAGVELKVQGEVFTWQFDTTEQASRFARNIANVCNEEMGVKPNGVSKAQPGVAEQVR